MGVQPHRHTAPGISLNQGHRILRYSLGIVTCGWLFRRNIQINAANSNAGSQIHSSSVCRIANPCGVKKRVTAIGETRIGLHGRKYRVLSKGEKNATPSPPFVVASSKPWLAVARNKYASSPFPRD